MQTLSHTASFGERAGLGDEAGALPKGRPAGRVALEPSRPCRSIRQRTQEMFELAREFEGIHDREQISRLVGESAHQLGQGGVAAFVPVLSGFTAPVRPWTR